MSLHRDAAVRFWRGFIPSEMGCWIWQGNTLDRKGYARFQVHGKGVFVHRWAYEYLRGPIPEYRAPEWLQVDHLCRVRNCVNPRHMELVTRRDNILRGSSRSALNARKDRCIRGHALSGRNLYIHTNGRRKCRACRQAERRRRTLVDGAARAAGEEP
jgi:HNH endonuclease